MISLDIFAPAVKQSAEAITEFVKCINEIIISSEKAFNFVVKSNERRRLKKLLAMIIKVRYEQWPLPNALRCCYSDPDKIKDNWDLLTSLLTRLNDNVCEILEILEKEKGDFPIRCRIAYENLLFGMKDRKEIYDVLRNMPPPDTTDDLEALLKIADVYEHLIIEVKIADRVVAEYLSGGEESTLLSEDEIQHARWHEKQIVDWSGLRYLKKETVKR